MSVASLDCVKMISPSILMLQWCELQNEVIQAGLWWMAMALLVSGSFVSGKYFSFNVGGVCSRSASTVQHMLW